MRHIQRIAALGVASSTALVLVAIGLFRPDWIRGGVVNDYGDYVVTEPPPIAAEEEHDEHALEAETDDVDSSAGQLTDGDEEPFVGSTEADLDADLDGAEAAQDEHPDDAEVTTSASPHASLRAKRRRAPDSAYAKTERPSRAPRRNDVRASVAHVTPDSPADLTPTPRDSAVLESPDPDLQDDSRSIE